MTRALSDFNVPELCAQLTAWGFKPSHAPRLLRSFYNSGGSVDWAELKCGRALQERLQHEIPLRQSHVITRNVSSDGTIKLLIAFSGKGAGGGAVESVLMSTPYADRAAACVSSQIGCAMGCDFCASTRRGLERNLTSGEIVEQFLHLREEARRSKRRLATLVFMGMGEPLQNFEHVIDAIRRIAGEDLGALGWRQVTVSTVGIVPGIERLADTDLNINLAVSLHAPDDETRSQIVPMNRRYPVADVMRATRRYFEKTGRITNIEYCMLGGVNDSDEHAEKLAALLDGFRTHLNLIPYNSIGTGVSGAIYRQPAQERLTRFIEILRGRGVVAHFRQTRGDDVNAACGQLRETAMK